MLSKGSDSKEIHRDLRIDVGPAYEVPDQCLEVSSLDGVSVGEQGGEWDDTSALLSKSQVRA